MAPATRKALLSSTALLGAQALVLFLSLRSVASASQGFLSESWRTLDPFQQVHPLCLKQSRPDEILMNSPSIADAVKFARAWKVMDKLCGGNDRGRFICKSKQLEFQIKMHDYLAMVDQRVKKAFNILKGIEDRIETGYEVQEARTMIESFCQRHSLYCWSVLRSQKLDNPLSQCKLSQWADHPDNAASSLFNFK